MRYEIDGNLLFETTGRKVYVFGALSCDPLQPQLIYYGYDGALYTNAAFGAFEDNKLTLEERREVAEFMVEQWKEWLAAGEATE